VSVSAVARGVKTESGTMLMKRNAAICLFFMKHFLLYVIESQYSEILLKNCEPRVFTRDEVSPF
jgi:hypothetical protein